MTALARRCDICAVITDKPYRRGDGSVVCRGCVVSAVDRAGELADEYERAVAIRLLQIGRPLPCWHTTPVAGCRGGCARLA